MSSIFFWLCVTAVVLIAVFYPLVLQAAVIGGAVIIAAGRLWLHFGTRAISAARRRDRQ